MNPNEKIALKYSDEHCPDCHGKGLVLIGDDEKYCYCVITNRKEEQELEDY